MKQPKITPAVLRGLRLWESLALADISVDPERFADQESDSDDAREWLRKVSSFLHAEPGEK